MPIDARHPNAKVFPRPARTPKPKRLVELADELLAAVDMTLDEATAGTLRLQRLQ